MKYKPLLYFIFAFALLAVINGQRSPVRAVFPDECTTGIYCTGPCDTPWPPPNNCACNAQLCNNYTLCPGNPDYGSCCIGHLELQDAYGNCSVCISGCTVCGGENIIQGTCPSYYNPCLNVCNGATPTPTPTPVPQPLCPNGTCGGTENCLNCWQDCGACPVVGATPTPPPAGTCGNGVCGGGENCGNCTSDCGLCPMAPVCSPDLWGVWGSCSGSPATKSRTNGCGNPQSTPCTGSIQARAVVVSATDTSCPTVQASTTGVPSAVHQFTPLSASQPAPQTQSGASYVTFGGVVGGTYTIAPTVPAGYVLTTACWSRTLNALTSGQGLTASLSVPVDSETLTWDLGYTLGTPWVQTGTGDVFAAGALTSSISSLTSPRSFNLDGTGGSPGMVTYGTSYDFDSDPILKGENYVSSKNWLMSEIHTPVINYYDYFRIKLGGAFPVYPTNPAIPVLKPPSQLAPYFVSGDMTTSGDWVVADGETIIFIVDGNLTLNGKVNLTGSGFIAFIVNGNITVSSSVGGLYTSNTPVIEGIYVTSPTGSFQTGTSSVVGKERLVGQGMFVAGSFLLQRDLDGISQNTTTSSELFLYNPRLFFSMPDSMRDVPITWEEVAP